MVYLFHCHRRLTDVLKRKRTPKRAVTSNRKTRQDSDNNLSSSVMQDLFSKGILLFLKKLGSLELPGEISLERACCNHQTNVNCRQNCGLEQEHNYSSETLWHYQILGYSCANHIKWGIFLALPLIQMIPVELQLFFGVQLFALIMLSISGVPYVWIENSLDLEAVVHSMQAGNHPSMWKTFTDS